MKIILNIVLIIMTLILPINVKPNAVSNKYSEFIANINEYYESYKIDYIEKDTFTICIIEGICNEELSYGVFLGSMNSGNYFVRVVVSEKEYSLPTDSRKDTIAYCVKHPNEVTVINVYDSNLPNGNAKYSFTLNYETKEAFQLVSAISCGKNIGCSLTKMVREYKTSTIVFVIVGICSVIIIGCLLIILYIKKHKKGLFNQNNKFESDLKFFDKNDESDDNDRIKNQNIENQNIENQNIENQNIDYKEIKVYDRIYEYEEDEVFDIKPLLIEKGYKTEYKKMNEEEKNEVMIYLMTLRHLNKITEKQCHDEEVKLWKK